MIVKDEEEFLEECLLSISDLADEIVIVDTGSKDSTPDIARRFSARVFSYPWRDDFSSARNEALKHARGNWILHIDADERIRPISPLVVKGLVTDRSKAAYYCLAYVKKGSTPVYLLRFFRSDPRIRYKGIIHENITEDLFAVSAQNGLRVGYSPLVLDHLGYEDGMREVKAQRNMPLLQRELKRRPNKRENWYHLCGAYETLGDLKRAKSAITKGIKIVREMPVPWPVDARMYCWLIQHELIEKRDTAALLKEAIGLFPRNPSLYWLQGKAWMVEERWKDAIPFFHWLTERGARGQFNRAMPHPEEILHSASYESLGTCYLKLGRYATALTLYQRACDGAPENLQYRVKRDLCARLLQQKGTRRWRIPTRDVAFWAIKIPLMEMLRWMIIPDGNSTWLHAFRRLPRSLIGKIMRRLQ